MVYAKNFTHPYNDSKVVCRNLTVIVMEKNDPAKFYVFSNTDRNTGQKLYTLPKLQMSSLN